MSSRNRKLVYMFSILALLIPIGALGMPARERSQPGQPGQSGGKIARLRHEYRLGETTLGDVDPASATMNLVLLGMRGVAGTMLWMQADEQKRMKNWSELEQTTESIIKLQPRFLDVWQFQGWNLAYNVSVECDAVEDRFFWVKKGVKFMLRGTNQNEDASPLYHDTGTMMGKKMGRSDEHKQFRRYFKSDPDPRWEGQADEEINPNGQDNYLVAKEYYNIANEKELLPWVEQHIMERTLFRSYPARSQMDYATAIENDGQFDEVTVNAWKTAHEDWTNVYGREDFLTTGGGIIKLGATDEELQQLADEDPNNDVASKRNWLDRYQKMTNYPYWAARSKVESEPEMVETRRKLYEGKKLFFKQDILQARELLESGLNDLQAIFEKHPILLDEQEMVEDIIKSQLMWFYVLRISGEPNPETFPMMNVWNQNPALVSEMDQRLQERVSDGL
ncbi:MAG: hypothetical protein KDA86_03395 [Planctomycetaceae bacterium]|nr:hypothetical protein [Planctomycetaceae bacterium]